MTALETWVASAGARSRSKRVRYMGDSVPASNVEGKQKPADLTRHVTDPLGAVTIGTELAYPLTLNGDTTMHRNLYRPHRARRRPAFRPRVESLENRDTPSTTVLDVAPNPATVGQAVTLTATVTGEAFQPGTGNPT